MNQLTTFGSLCSRADTIGYKINKVVFRGFHSSDAAGDARQGDPGEDQVEAGGGHGGAQAVHLGH